MPAEFWARQMAGSFVVILSEAKNL